MMRIVYFAVYRPNPRRGTFVLVGRPRETREEASESEAAKGKGALIVPGTMDDFQPVMAEEGIKALICRMTEADNEPAVTD